MMVNAKASWPPAASTGMVIWDSEVTSIWPGNRTTAAHAAIATDNTPPSGKPTSTLSREVPRSLTVHFSSTAPEEKKNTS
jgi:hypothetical protein